ncbi:MAG: restriction endonuclease subunit S [Segatella copri]|nr:restriction endonuclease subunit S [Segatella copri]
MEWKEVRLGDVCSIQRGASPRPIQKFISKEGMPWVKIADATGISSRYISSTSEYIIKEGISKSRIVHPGDLIVSNSATPGLPKFMAIEACVHDGWLIIRDLDGIDKVFLYYVFINIRRRLSNQANGSVFMNLKTDIVKDFVIKLPTLDDQRRIASILSSLDRKIELNNKINADLEEMAQAIFKNWFVDFEPFKDGKFVNSELGRIPEGWKVGKITDIGCLITDYVSNGSFASLKQNVHLYETKEYAQFIRNTDLKTNTFSVYVDKHSYDFLSKSTLYGNEIIISNVGDVGSVHLCPKLDIPMTLGNNIIMLRPNEKEYNYFLYLWFKYFSGQGLIQGIKGGSAQPKFNKTDFKNLPLLIPSFEIIERSYWIFESMFSILSSNVKENSRLSLLRDTLLPRLMSGELEVPE